MEIKNLAEQYIYWPEVNNPYQKNINFSNVTMEEFTPLLVQEATKSKVLVSDSIIRFYALNEMLAKIRQQENEVLEVENVQLYNQYMNEVEITSKKIFAYIFSICIMEARHCLDFKRMETIDERLNSAVYYSEEENKDHIHKKYMERKEEYVADKIKNYSTRGKVTGDDFKVDDFQSFYTMLNKLAEIGSYDRDQIVEDVIPYLRELTLKDISLEQVFVYLETIFTVGSFGGGYGGLPWGKIANHGLQFVQGKMNAEVFIDQAFSLEHNNGNMFNKDLIFDTDNITYWKSCELGNPHSSIQSDRVMDIQLFLNAQHQGQLLSLLKYGETTIDTNLTMKSMDSYRKMGIIDKATTTEDIYRVITESNSNIYDLNNIIVRFKERNFDFCNQINNVSVEVPNIDFYAILNNATKTDKKKKINLNEKHLAFHRLTNQIVMDFYNKNQGIEAKVEQPYSYNFEYLDTKNIPEEKYQKQLLGNKALGLAQMHAMNLPVPNAIVFPTNNANSFFNEKAKWINSLRPQLNTIKNYFTDKKGNPVLCSVRSGAPVSMPGMMDTILNVGIDDSNYHYFCSTLGREVTNECIVKFMSLFSKSLLNADLKFSPHLPKALFQFREVLSANKISQSFDGMFPLNARQQYKWCLEAVFGSWHSDRATAYRNHQNIDHDIGTAAIVQQMVFGNLNENSCTGVVFSRDCISGKKGIIGEFLIKAQGEDVVSGSVTPQNIQHMSQYFPEAYSQLVKICENLETQTGDIQDIEFTIENKNLYILQKRKAVCSSLAQAKLNQELFESGLITEEKMLSDIKVDSLIVRDIVDCQHNKEQCKGLVGNPGVMRGIVIHSEADMDKYKAEYEANQRDTNFGWIFYAPETSPDHAPIMIKTQAFITSNGGFTSHAAILSRSWDKPCIVGLGNEDDPILKAGSLITVDANTGKIYKDILPLKEGSKKEIESVINRVLAYHNIDREQLIKTNPFENVLNEVNAKQSWLEKYDKAKTIEKTPVRVSNFLDISHKLALLLIKNESKLHVQKAHNVLFSMKDIKKLEEDESVDNWYEDDVCKKIKERFYF